MKNIRTAQPGDDIEPVALHADPIRIQRFGAATHNAHRIHYDTRAAHAEGLADPVVMAQLHGTLFFRAAARYAGDPAAVRSVSWQNRAPAAIGSTLTVTGVVDGVEGGTVTLRLEERDDAGTVCATGHAVVGSGAPVC